MNSETNNYQEKLKENINKLVENNRLEEAKELLGQYKHIVKDDIDIYSIEGVIAMIEGDMNDAERFLLEGVNKDSNNFDILYNLGFLYQSKKKNELAIEYYKRAFQNAKNEEDTHTIYTILKDLGVKEDKNQLLDSRKKHDTIFPKSNEKISAQEQMEVYKKQFKENIQLLIGQGLLQEAKDMLNEYKKIIQNDIETYSIEGIIHMLEGNMNRAESIFLKGIKKAEKNFDLLYNLAYLYQRDSQNELAKKYYKKALRNTKNEVEVDEVYKVLKELGEEKSKKEIMENDKTKVNRKQTKVITEKINDIKSIEGYLRKKYNL